MPTKTCPFCAEEIQEAAIVCKHCRRDLVSPYEAQNVISAAPAALPTPTTIVVKQKSQPGCATIGCGGILAFLVIATLVGQCSPRSTPTPSTGALAPAVAPKPLSVDINVSVRFNGTQFLITNNSDTQTWTDATADLNGGVFSSGYVMRLGDVKPNQTVTVGAMQFAKSDGTRFNPFQLKAQKMTITTKVNGEIAVESVRWE